MKNKAKCIQEYKNYLQSRDHFQWSFWCTITTQNKLTHRSAHRLIDRFVNIFRKFILRKKSLSADPSKIFYIVEPYKQKGGVHIHLLLQCDNSIRYKLLRMLFNQAIGIRMGKSVCRINAIHQEEHIFQYVAEKLVLRRVEYDVIQIMPFHSV